jgi:hypothetical protein
LEEAYMICAIKNPKSPQVDTSTPQLLISEVGLIICAVVGQTGTVVIDSATSKYGFGYKSTRWVWEEFKPFNGVVELKNDWVESI